ncbi:MAG: BrnA antitoxin family protein [Bdellovibrionota bacterium]
MKNKKLTNRKVELEGDYLESKNAKIKVTTWVDGDIVIELKKRADESKGKYQTLMNEILREYLFNEKSSHKLEIENIVERKLKDLGLLKKRA